MGETSFVEKITGLLKDKTEIKEIPRIQRYATQPHLAELLEERKAEDKEIIFFHYNNR